MHFKAVLKSTTQYHEDSRPYRSNFGFCRPHADYYSCDEMCVTKAIIFSLTEKQSLLPELFDQFKSQGTWGTLE